MSVDCQIEREIGTLSESPRGWKKKINLIVWNGNFAKYDIRTWDPYDQPKGGVTLTIKELLELHKLIGAELERCKGEAL